MGFGVGHAETSRYKKIHVSPPLIVISLTFNVRVKGLRGRIPLCVNNNWTQRDPPFLYSLVSVWMNLELTSKYLF